MTDPAHIVCEQALRLLAEYLDGELSEREHHRVRHHLDVCRSCYSRAEFERRLRARLARLGRGPVPRGFEDRVRALIGQFGRLPESSSSDR